MIWKCGVALFVNAGLPFKLHNLDFYYYYCCCGQIDRNVNMNTNSIPKLLQKRRRIDKIAFGAL